MSGPVDWNGLRNSNPLPASELVLVLNRLARGRVKGYFKL